MQEHTDENTNEFYLFIYINGEGSPRYSLQGLVDDLVGRHQSGHGIRRGLEAVDEMLVVLEPLPRREVLHLPELHIRRHLGHREHDDCPAARAVLDRLLNTRWHAEEALLPASARGVDVVGGNFGGVAVGL